MAQFGKVTRRESSDLVAVRVGAEDNTPPDYEREPYELYSANRKEVPMTEQSHGRYFAQELVLDQDADARGQIQNALDAGERREWHLVGVSDVQSERSVILFWDTVRPSFGRTSQ